MLKENKYYVYAYLDPSEKGEFNFEDLVFEYKPFYIGKGSGRRFKDHLKNISLQKNTHKNNKIKKILSEGKEPIILFIYKDLTQEESLNLEANVINKIGLRNLTNVTIGGFGTNGYKHSEETKNKIKNSLTGKNIGRELTEEWKLKIKNNNAKYWLNKNHSEETKQKLKLINQGKEYPERRKKYIITSPCGEVIIVDNLSKFCIENNLQRTKMVSVANQQRTHHKGFICSKLDN